MAKKDPTDMPVEERLKTLFQLQTTLSGIDEKRALRGELPLEVQDLEDEIEGLTTRIEKIQNEINEYEQAVTVKKGEIETAKASVERYKAQLNDVKNNREYDTLSKEIEYQSLEIELCNKKIKEANFKIEEKKQELAQNQEVVDDRRQALDLKKSELDEIMEETRSEEEKLKAKVKDLEAKIEPRLLTSFKRIRKNARNGLGIVYVQRDACGGCFNKIPPQRQLDIKMHKKVIVCEYCGRILIDPELAGVKIDKVVGTEEKKTRKRAIRKTTKKEIDDDVEVKVPEIRDASYLD
jgi:predicted  nucleic acid-binding Zn-ribbon protein